MARLTFALYHEKKDIYTTRVAPVAGAGEDGSTDVPNAADADAQSESKSPDAPVLIVDDDAVIRGVLRSALEDVGIKVNEAADGQVAVNYVARQRPALILLDMGLPILDGVAVGLRVRLLYNSLPIIVLSADSQVVEKAQHVGAIAYLQKPFDMDTLLDTVQYALQIPYASTEDR